LTTLAQRLFSSLDQDHFASISGDHHPMHMDALQARRTQAGAPVVHGVHLLLWALESLAAAQHDLPKMRRIRCDFSKFVYVGERVDVELLSEGPRGTRLSISVDHSPRAKVVIDFGGAVEECPSWSAEPLETVASPSHPLNPSFDDLSERTGRISFQMTGEQAADAFPCATRWLGAKRIASLAATTQLVGMVCPGLHSIYSGLTVAACTESHSGAGLAFRVTETDPRFNSIEQEIAGGGLTGTVSGFARTPPVGQATMESLVGVVAPDEFKESLALIVGGSRGLGELTAKLIATGGGHVLITWQSGKDDAERVAEEIRSFGGLCETLAYDARKPADEQLAQLAEAPTHAYYFATPAIFRTQSEMFSSERLNEFLSVYVDGFWQLARFLRARRSEISLYYPSSIAVTERPKGMTEYTMAKAAGEVLCADMNASLSPLRVFVSRLPRLPTDQTATVTPVEAADPLATMLPIIREVQSWPAKT
jgi:NADP-dependent 3-hydroxy acid dehydrogenase YdfG